MFLKSKIYRVALACFLVLSMSGLAFADTIRLKDGSIIKGKIVNFGDGKFTIVIGDGTRQRQMSFFADEVDSIEFDATSIQTSNNSQPTFKNTSAQKDPDNTIITVGQTTETKPTPTPTTPQTKPILLNLKVLADNTANGWTNSGWVVRKGQKIRISGKGQVNLGNGRYSSSGGIGSLPDKDKLLQTEATGGLIAVIGDDNNEFIFVGAAREFVAPRDGALFLGINEGNLEDNSGAFEVTVEITPN